MMQMGRVLTWVWIFGVGAAAGAAAVAAWAFVHIREVHRRAAEQYARQVTALSMDAESLRAQLAEAQQTLGLSRYYARMARAARCSHEPSVALVEAVLRAVGSADINKCRFEADDVMALLLVESCYNPQAVSKAGAVGLGQVMPKTAKAYGVDDPSRLFEPDLSVELAVRILNDYATAYNCDRRMALLAYNRGPARVAELLRQGNDPSNRYDDAVLRLGGAP